ncbi:type II toxin-antitoxin system HicA family toxin [Patescibacteria group bacterium]|nr:type II toxin-antitoxin system HicA family toxin [Patescibacteria group bacterium]
MTKLPVVQPKDLARALCKLGFETRSGKGSHVIFYKPEGRRAAIPMHPKPLGKGLLHKILRQLDISREELKENL